MKQNIAIKLLTVLFFCGLTGDFCQAQLTYSLTTLSDVNGNPVMMKKGVTGEAAHFYSTNYQPANLYISGNEKPVTGHKFKLDLQENKLYYQDEASGTELELTSPVKMVEFLIDPAKGPNIFFERGFPAIDKLTMDNYYQVLVGGKANLLLDTKFEEISYKEYNSATTTKRIDKLNSYYGFFNNSIRRLLKPEDVLLLLSDKTKELSELIKKENLKIKKQADLEKIFTYYNTLSQ